MTCDSRRRCSVWEPASRARRMCSDMSEKKSVGELVPTWLPRVCRTSSLRCECSRASTWSLTAASLGPMTSTYLPIMSRRVSRSTLPGRFSCAASCMEPRQRRRLARKPSMQSITCSSCLGDSSDGPTPVVSGVSSCRNLRSNMVRKCLTTSARPRARHSMTRSSSSEHARAVTDDSFAMSTRRSPSSAAPSSPPPLPSAPGAE